jgi:peptidoglycan biosynthesis protein MviN/MurJ (putative lipid II flippase)
MPLYGKTFTDFTPLVFLAISTIPTALAQVLELTLYSRDKMWTCFGFNIIWGVATVGLSYMFLRNNQGASGIALAVLLAYILKMICMGGYLFISKKGGRR